MRAVERGLTAHSHHLEDFAVVKLPISDGWLQVCGVSGIEVERKVAALCHCHVERVGRTFA